MRYLGIDFGERRIGLALSDPEGRWALPLDTLERQTDRRAAYRIAELARCHGVDRLVIGRPPEEGAASGLSAERVGRFADRLARAATLPIEWIDESLTTDEAGRRLRQAGISLRGQRGRRDAVAAQILLQEALDRAARGTEGVGS